jgi:hypothetical protein
VKPIEGPQLGFFKTLGIDKLKGLGQQLTTNTFASNPVVHDEPTQVRRVVSQIFTINGN